MNIRDMAIHCEAQKVGISQSEKGVVLRLLIHPQDVPADLLVSAIGTRYVVALVETNDQSEPIKPERKREGDRLVASAGMLCGNPAFQRWAYNNLDASGVSESAAADALRAALHIESRKELSSNESAQRAFRRLLGEFQDGIGTQRLR